MQKVEKASRLIFLLSIAPIVITLFLWSYTSNHTYEKNKIIFNNHCEEIEKALLHRLDS
jgi:hypothetical protein